VRADLDDLNHQISEAVHSGKTVSPSWLYRQERYKALLSGIQQRVGQFTDTASQRIYNEMLRAYHDGGTDAMSLLRASLPQGVSYAFTHPPLAAFEALSRDTLGKLFSGYGRETALDVRKALLQGIARGQGPAQIARAVRDAMSGPLWKALRISRTETMRAYNSASSVTYRQNAEVLQGWEWLTGPDPCPFCASQAGKVFSVDETLDSHPQCRCTQRPLTKSWDDILSPLGVDVSQFPALAG
jgi:SPP1 gp7 family putative phage head morphogenesis protein